MTTGSDNSDNEEQTTTPCSVLPAVSYSDKINLDEITLPTGITVDPPPHNFDANKNGEPRLIITHIVNYNFKSYSGKQILGPFHKSFTAIVGPNGSGKSNVIDSMLFVFGFRANKIRSKKISVLIHNSENHKDATSCTVEVHFEKGIDNEDGSFSIVPNSSFYVSRTAFKDNSSQYHLNKKRVQFKQIAELLQGSGVDLNHNRFLILQGEVEQIALMKPMSKSPTDHGMLEFLEDIIGSIRFKDAIEKLNVEIEDLDEKRKDKLSRVKVVEKEKEQLEPIRNEAIQFLKKENECTLLDNKLIQREIKQLNDALARDEENVKKMTAEIEEVEKKLTELKDHKSGKKKRNFEIS